MGIIKATAAAISGTMDDVWKEIFVCDSLPPDILMARGFKRVSGRSANTGGNPDIITHGSLILVADGQCAVVVSGGKVIDSYAEPGEYTFRDPDFAPGLGGLLLEAGQRISFGGDAPPKMQRVYYINIKECLNNPFTAVVPLSLRSAGEYGFDGNVLCRGVFSYRIKDPGLFYRLLAGNVSKAYTRAELTGQITSEFLTALGPALNACCAGGIRPADLPAHTEELAQALRETADRGWLGQRGIEIFSVGISSLVPASSDMRELQRMSRAAALFDPAPEEAKPPEAWNCLFCGAESTGAFCPQCGKPRKWTCACGRENLGKFCRDCGNPRS